MFIGTFKFLCPCSGTVEAVVMVMSPFLMNFEARSSLSSGWFLC